jgi:hypothetical protein
MAPLGAEVVGDPLADQQGPASLDTQVDGIAEDLLRGLCLGGRSGDDNHEPGGHHDRRQHALRPLHAESPPHPYRASIGLRPQQIKVPKPRRSR